MAASDGVSALHADAGAAVLRHPPLLMRRLLPDVILTIGVLVTFGGAYLLSPAAAILAFGVMLIALAIWMGA